MNDNLISVIIVEIYSCTHLRNDLDFFCQEEHQTLHHDDSFPLHDEDLSSSYVRPPSNLSVDVKSGTQAIFSWETPEDEVYDKFEVQLSQLPNDDANQDEQQRDLVQPEQQQQPKTFSVEDRSVSLSSYLEPGNSYQVQVFAVAGGDISEPVSANFTTSMIFACSTPNFYKI